MGIVVSHSLYYVERDSQFLTPEYVLEMGRPTGASFRIG